MPTPIAAARQCLTPEAAAVLDEAVAVARRRCHSQTTSLHMVSSLLSLPSSSLREACSRTRNNAYSSRVQFKALELSLGVSLDRLPSSQASKVEEPPVSNSLMAAIKRSQANQRRQPENFTFYQQQQQQYSSSSSSVPIVKVELQNLVLSILDDPLVSKVLGEAGFRSCDIKMATLRPANSFHPPHLFGYTSRYKRPSPPLFLCNLTNTDSSNLNLSDVCSKGFSFPFLGCFSGDENSTRIGEIMLRGERRSPLLVGVSASDVLRNFLETMKVRLKGVLPEELSGLSVVCVRDEISKCLSGDCDEEPLKVKFEEVERLMGEDSGKIVIDFGDLQALDEDGVGVDCLRNLVGKLGKMVESYRGKLWLIGSAASSEVYFKIRDKIPSIEEDWDLQVLHTTSLKFSPGGSYPRSSLMESFVPLGGFFPLPSETQSTTNTACQFVSRCNLCNEKYEQEVAALSKGGFYSSVAQENQSSLPCWLQTTTRSSLQSSFSSIKGKDDSLLLNTKTMMLQKKWDAICQQNHFRQTFSQGYNQQLSPQFPRAMGLQAADKEKENKSNNNSSSSKGSSNEQVNKNVSSSLSTDVGQTSLKALSSLDMPAVVRSRPFDSLSASINDGRMSPTSVTSVTTDLGLGIISASTCKTDKARLDLVQDSPSQSSWCFYRDNQMLLEKDPKLLYRALVEKVRHQDEAIGAIIEVLTRCQMRTCGLGNIWINFRGHDRIGKRQIGVALAEILYGTTESFVYVDLSFQDETARLDTLLNTRVRNKYNLTMRGTVVDYLVEKLSKKPSVVFLENIEKADPVVQNSLSRAVKTGRFADLHGREVNVSNCIFLGTTNSTRFTEGSNSLSVRYTEEEVLSSKGSSLQILIRFDLNDDPTAENSHEPDGNKRKLFRVSTSMDHNRPNKASKSYLDLNLPAEGSDCNTPYNESDSDSTSENSKSWLEDFEGEIDRIVVFKPFDFENLADKLLKKTGKCLQDIVGFQCSLEMETDVIQQILAAAYLLGNRAVEDWIEKVVVNGFVEMMEKFCINAHSVVKLVKVYDEQPEGLLPDRIIVQ